MIRVCCAALAGAVVVFIWGMISWMALPFHTATLHSLPHAEAEVQAFLGRLPHSGVYHYPGFPHNEDGSPVTEEQQNTAFEQMRRGPLINLLVYRQHGKEPFSPVTFATGFLLNLVAALLAAGLLASAAPALPRYGERVLFVAALGLFAAAAVALPEWLWWSYPSDFAVAMTADVVIAWFLAALVIAGLMGPRPAAATAPARATGG